MSFLIWQITGILCWKIVPCLEWLLGHRRHS